MTAPAKQEQLRELANRGRGAGPRSTEHRPERQHADAQRLAELRAKFPPLDFALPHSGLVEPEPIPADVWGVVELLPVKPIAPRDREVYVSASGLRVFVVVR